MRSGYLRQVNCSRLQTVMSALTGANELVAQMSLWNWQV